MEKVDPKGLMQDAYIIEGIRIEECRSIFLDWALGIPVDQDARLWIEDLLARYGQDAPDHPMTQVLREGLADKPNARRRGGRKARLPQTKN